MEWVTFKTQTKTIAERQHIKVLDGLRGYAALLIVLAHAPRLADSDIWQSINTLSVILKFGYIGVDIFFVLSGFLITRILIREKQAGTFSFKRFYLKRALRIFPIYYLTIFLCGICITWKGIAYTATYLSNYYFSYHTGPHPLSHTWSLAVEEHYYLLWPLLIGTCSLAWLRRNFLLWVCLFVTIGLALTLAICEPLVIRKIVYNATHFRILSIAFGSMLAFYESEVRALDRGQLIRLGALFLIVFGLATHIQFIPLLAFLPYEVWRLWLFAFSSTLLFVLVFRLEDGQSIFRWLFTNVVIRFIGKISYAVYLFHFPIFFWFELFPNQTGGRKVLLSEFMLPLALVFLLPMLSYFLIERPLLKMKDRLHPKS
ncbi:MAG: acyltransferase [Bacteroidota bacterium]